MKPMVGWKPGHEPEISDRRKIDLGDELHRDKPTSGWSGERHTVGRKPPKDFNPGGENKG